MFFFYPADRESFPNTQLFVPALDARKLKNESVSIFVQFAFDLKKKNHLTFIIASNSLHVLSLMVVGS